MNRRNLVAMFGLALAGCAQTHPMAPTAQNGPRMPPPVGLSPVPNIYEAIARDNPRIDPASLHPERGPVLAHLGGPPGPGAQPGPGPGPSCNCSDPSKHTAAFHQPPNGAPAPEQAERAPASPEIVKASGAPEGAEAAPIPLSVVGTPDAPVAADPLPEPLSAPAEPPPAVQPSEPAPPPPATELPELPAALPLPPGEPAAAGPGPEPAPGPEPGSTGPSDPPAPGPGPESPPDLPPLPEVDAKDPPGPGATAAVPLTPQAAPNPGAVARSAPSSPPPTVDRDVMTVAVDPASIRAEGAPVKLKEAGRVAARVGDEVITLHELTTAVKERIENLPNGYKPNRQEIKMVTSQVLDLLIERSVIIQEAKRELKNPKALTMFMDFAVKNWREEELPALIRKEGVLNEYELKKKLEEKGKFLDQMLESYKLDFLAKGYLEQKLRPRIRVDVPEMLAYYNAHRNDFDRPEQWTWREVLVEVDKHPSRAEARKKAEAILARLRRGDDFAKVAQAESEGPNRDAGGLWETTPESYAVAAVNDALKSLSPGQASPILEGPSSYHIVRVESRRPAGPAAFHEVQDKVRNVVHREKVKQESIGYLDKLRKQTVITTIFDNTDFAPAATRVSTSANP